MEVGDKVCRFPRSLQCGVITDITQRTQSHPTPMSPSTYTVYHVLWEGYMHPQSALHEDIQLESDAWPD